MEWRSIKYKGNKMSDLRESEITNVNLKKYEPRVYQGNMKSYEVLTEKGMDFVQIQGILKKHLEIKDG